MITASVEKPILESCLLMKAILAEKVESCLILFLDYCIQLVQMQYTQGIAFQLHQRSRGIALTTMGIQNNDTRLCPLVPRIEMHQISQSYCFTLLILYNQTDLTVCVDVVTRGSNVIVQRIA